MMQRNWSVVGGEWVLQVLETMKQILPVHDRLRPKRRNGLISVPETRSSRRVREQVQLREQVTYTMPPSFRFSLLVIVLRQVRIAFGSPVDGNSQFLRSAQLADFLRRVTDDHTGGTRSYLFSIHSLQRPNLQKNEERE